MTPVHVRFDKYAQITYGIIGESITDPVERVGLGLVTRGFLWGDIWATGRTDQNTSWSACRNDAGTTWSDQRNDQNTSWSITR